jgi:ADP-dependent NAD(P)H-hydrate dehydratase / NAD(P)H-hydrate epimerase
MNDFDPNSPILQSFLVTAAEMQQIEARLFEAGMPVAALMEKVSGRIVNWLLGHYSSLPEVQRRRGKIGILAGPGHNGGDALVVARELHHLGFEVLVYQPFDRCKPLTAQHASYAKSLNISFVPSVQPLAECDAIVDGWFGFGLERAISMPLAADIDFINQLPVPVFSIDLPSGLHTNTGQVMGAAIRASYTACLGLWKRGFMAESALDYLGECELINFDIPLAQIAAVLGESPKVRRLSDAQAIAYLPLQRALTAHKYKAGHLLLVAGSRQYAGAALLTGLGAIASGVGMLTLAVPESIRLTLLPQLPGALLVGCPETANGAISQLPADLDLHRYDAIALGPGLTSATPNLLETLSAADCPLLLDADGLNLLSAQTPVEWLKKRTAPTLLTPHWGEFKRLFPEVVTDSNPSDTKPGDLVVKAAQLSEAMILLKGPRSAIALPVLETDEEPDLWFNPHSTPALARGGSGDVLTGLMGGLVAAAVQTAVQTADTKSATQRLLGQAMLAAVWWHSQAAIAAANQRSLLGVDPLQLAHALNPVLQAILER